MSPRVLVYTVSFGDTIPAYVKASVGINKAYCETHGYEFREFILPTNFPRHPAWGRVWFLRQQLSTYDYMFYIDGDAFFADHSRSLSRLITFMDETPVCGLFARDQMLANKVFHSEYANAGVFLFSRQHDGPKLADLWWEVPTDDTYDKTLYDSLRYLSASDSLYHHPYEQLALWHLWDRHPMSFRFVKKYNELNGLDGTFVKHLIKVPDRERLRIMQNYKKLI